MAPSKRRAVPRHRDEDDDEPTPSRRSRRRDDDDDEEDEEDEAPRRRRRDDDDDEEDERPRNKRSKRADDDDDGGAVRGGWTEAQKQMDSTSDFAQSLKLEEKAVIIKFLDDTPYANFRRHWIERTGQQGKTVRAWTCLQTVGKACPLCDVGDRAQAVAAFNVALIGDDGQVLLKSWDVGPRLFNVLKGYSNDPKIGPLSKGYFMVSKTGKKGTTQHNVSSISRSSLSQDYDIEPPEQRELDALVKYTPEVVPIPPAKTVRELAEELAEDYDDD